MYKLKKSSSSGEVSPTDPEEDVSSTITNQGDEMKYYTSMTKYNCGIDLHARQMYICVTDREGNILVHKNIKGNDFAFFLKIVAPYFDLQSTKPSIV